MGGGAGGLEEKEQNEKKKEKKKKYKVIKFIKFLFDALDAVGHLYQFCLVRSSMNNQKLRMRVLLIFPYFFNTEI